MPQGSLALYRRHLRCCKSADKGNRWTRCQCPIWVQRSIGGETIRRSLNTGNWTAASSIVHQWQSSGRIGVLKPDLPTVTEAVEKFLKEAAVRNLAATTIKKRRELLEGTLLPFCAHRGHRKLRDLTVERPITPTSAAVTCPSWLRAGPPDTWRYARSAAESG